MSTSAPARIASLPGVNLREVWERLRPLVRPTTLIESDRLNAVIGSGVRILLVTETFQHTGSFKFRAALSLALHSDATHLLTASSGNYGAALARASQQAGKRCTVVMPARSAQVKIDAVKSYGAVVDLVDTDKVSRGERVEQLHRADPAARVVSPFDDPYVVAGNSSLGAELFARETPDAVLAPVGGGGLSSGLVVARNELGVSCPIYGAEPALGNDAARSLRDGAIRSNEKEPETLADGARTLAIGKLNFEILRTGLADIVEVTEESIARGVKVLFESTNLKAEPTGALSIGALLQDPARFSGKRVACIVSGGNVDPTLYAKLIVS